MTEDELAELLGRLCPMHLMLNATGHVIEAGATMRKLCPVHDLLGARFLDLFEVLRPRHVMSMEDLVAVPEGRLHLRFRGGPQTTLKGSLAPLGDRAVVNLSFGISLLDAVRDYGLSAADFAHTDLAIELLYLVEAKSAAMEASRNLNARLQGAKIAAEEQAFTDTLTGLKNRRALDLILHRYLGARVPFALMHVDLDYFKSVNDTLGHAAGDHVLQEVARVMVDVTRSDDTVARVGGDEFVIVFPKLRDRKQLDTIAKRLIERLEIPITYNGDDCRISGSMGTVLSDQLSDVEAGDLLHAADLALYAAKHGGRAGHRFFDPSMTAPRATGAPEASGRIN
ncbi:MAG: diguanylate cyclase [Paracoccaceae bacterium]